MKITRVLLFVAAGFYGLSVIVGFVVGGFNGAVTAYLLWVCWPGIFALAFGLRLRNGGRILFWAIVALQAVRIVMSLVVLGSGDTSGLTQLILPILTLVFVLRRESRDFFKRPRDQR
ncbi:hypothetical protein [Salinactinospora qingdaonensis]|uniref:hypothetical protein n=1 Tax=Salinactinospora qingdaonensis TaxID=702744 RepID=UPI0031E9601B